MDIKAVAIPISDLAPLLSGLLDRTVVDKTGLDGKFDVSIGVPAASMQKFTLRGFLSP
jgi:uncharacterized protein (TIGR03435 family)